MASDVEKILRNSLYPGGASFERLSLVERNLGVELPTEVRDFLNAFGGALFSGRELYGLPEISDNDPPMWHDLEKETLRLRDDEWYRDNRYFIPISNDGMGSTFFVDTRESPETHIWVIGPGIKKLISRDFGEFVLKLQSGNLDY